MKAIEKDFVNFELSAGTLSVLKGNYFDLVFTKYIESMLDKEGKKYYRFSLKENSLHNSDKDKIYLILDRDYEELLLSIGSHRILSSNGKPVNIVIDDYIALKYTLEKIFKYFYSGDYSESRKKEYLLELNELKKSLSFKYYKELEKYFNIAKEYFSVTERWIPDCVIFYSDKIKLFEFKTGKFSNKSFTDKQKLNINNILKSKLNVKFTVLNSECLFPKEYSINIFNYN
jgi:hypothetical protein